MQVVTLVSSVPVLHGSAAECTNQPGMLDDGTSFSDDDFYEYYPEAGEMRDMVPATCISM